MTPKKNNINMKYELVNFCEFDKYAEQSYCAVHGIDKSLNLGDITKVDETKIPHFNMICGSSPCQGFSTAGNQVGSRWKCKDCEHEYNPLTVHYSVRHQCPNCGSKDLDKSRSSLLVEWLRVIRANKPKWGIYENVKNIVSKKFQTTFDMFINELHEYGYNTYYKVLNSKSFGVPQSRERVFLVIILKEYDSGQFKFPESLDDIKFIENLFENKVDEKYYINTPQAQELINNLINEKKLDGGAKYRIRKPTPRECWRLMGFSDEDFEKAQDTGIKDTQLYKQACNSIVIDVLYYIFIELYVAMPYLFTDLKVSSYFSGIGAYEAALDRLYDALNSDNIPSSETNVSDMCNTHRERKFIIYDDYNSRIRADQTTIGTLTSTVGHSALRNSYKLIEKQLA